MEKDPNSQTNNVGEDAAHLSALSDMPSFEEHMKEIIPTSESIGQNYENGEKEESLAELRDRFINEDYSNRHADLSSASAVQKRDRKIQDNMMFLEYDLKHLDNYDTERLSEVENRLHKTIELVHRRNERKIEGEWSPARIAEKYGDRVEKYGVSLADINMILSAVGGASVVSNGMVFTPLENNGVPYEPYEYFCKNISGVIERHFSDNTPEEHKEMMGSIIRKYKKLENDWDNYYESTTEVEEPKREIDFTEAEIDFLAREYAEANKTAGNPYDRIYLDPLRGGSTTNDKLLDGLMYGLFDGSVWMPSLRASKIGKKMKEYMQ